MRDRPGRASRGQRDPWAASALSPPRAVEMMALVPAAHVPQDANREDGREREPGDAASAVRNDDQGGEQTVRRRCRRCRRPERSTAPDRAGRPRPSARCARIRDERPRSRRRRTPPPPARWRSSGASASVTSPIRVRPMPTLSEYGLRALVGIRADQRLQYRGADLVRQRDRADLRETQQKLALQQRIDRDDQRLDHVVEKVREADRAQHLEASGLRQSCRRGGGGRGRSAPGGRTILHDCSEMHASRDGPARRPHPSLKHDILQDFRRAGT